MNPVLIAEILQLVAGIVAKQTSGDVANDAQIASDLISIVTKAMAAYQQHVGEPLDVSLIKPEPPLGDPPEGI